MLLCAQKTDDKEKIMGLYNNRIVVKVGTSTLTNDSGKSDLRATDRLGRYP